MSSHEIGAHIALKFDVGALWLGPRSSSKTLSIHTRWFCEDGWKSLLELRCLWFGVHTSLHEPGALLYSLISHQESRWFHERKTRFDSSQCCVFKAFQSFLSLHFERRSTTLLPNDPECSLESLRTTMQPLVSTILSNNPYQPPTNTVLLRETLTNLALYAQRLERELSKQASSSSFDDQSPSSINDSDSGGLPLPMFSEPQNNNQAPATTDDDPEMAGLSDSMKHLLVLDTSKNRFFGPSSSVMLAKTAIEFSSRTKAALDTAKDFGFAGYRRPEFWTVRPVSLSPQLHRVSSWRSLFISAISGNYPRHISLYVNTKYSQIRIFFRILSSCTLTRYIHTSRYCMGRR